MKDISPVSIVEHRFAPRDVIAGDPALDFVNTVNGRDDSPSDWLDSYARLIEWATLAKLLPGNTLRALARKAEREPAAAAEALARAKLLREALFALIIVFFVGQSPPRDA